MVIWYLEKLATCEKGKEEKEEMMEERDEGEDKYLKRTIWYCSIF